MNNQIRNRFYRTLKIIRGWYLTNVKNKNTPYDESWWDEEFYGECISDSSTISCSMSVYASAYHYASIEAIILKYLYDNKTDLTDFCVLDIGSGSGHWVDFYERINCSAVVGVDVSKRSIEHLSRKYMGDPTKEFFKSKALEFLVGNNRKYDIINAVGVMFHIVKDDEWEKTIEKISFALPSRGLFIVGGQFGPLSANVQFNSDGTVNKRLRSKTAWKKVLLKNGFEKITIIRNHLAFSINRRLPENHILFAQKLNMT